MKLVCTVLVLSALALPVSAQSGAAPSFESGALAARVRGRRAPMPANGALPIESPDSSMPIVVMTDASGATIEGSVREAAYLSPGTLYAWLPSIPLMEGTYQVTLQHPWEESLHSTESVDVVAAIPASLPPLMFEASATWRSVPGEILPQACCTTPLGEQLFTSCFRTQMSSFVAVDPGMSSSAPAAQLNQFVFRLKIPAGAVGGGADLPFKVLEQVRPAGYSEPSDRYCVEVEAQNIATLAVQTYPEAACTDGVAQAVGTMDADVDAFLDRHACTVPPLEHEDRWCELNETACEESSEWCELYDFNCNDGPLPEVWQQLQRDIDDGLVGGMPVNASNDATNDEPAGGCSVSARPAPSSRGLALLLPVLGLFAVLRRFRRKFSDS